MVRPARESDLSLVKEEVVGASHFPFLMRAWRDTRLTPAEEGN